MRLMGVILCLRNEVQKVEMLEGIEVGTELKELVGGECIYTNEELENISSFCSTLQRIRSRLISEGYSINELRRKLLGSAMQSVV